VFLLKCVTSPHKREGEEKEGGREKGKKEKRKERNIMSIFSPSYQRVHHEGKGKRGKMKKDSPQFH